MYIHVLILCDVCVAVNRTTQAVRGHSPPWLLVLHILSKPSMVRGPIIL